MKIYHTKKSQTNQANTILRKDGIFIEDEDDPIKPGDEYFWAKAKYQDRVCSKDKEVVQLWIERYREGKKGEFRSNVDAWEDEMANLASEEDVEDLIAEIEAYIEEKQERLSNIPDQLQQNHIINEQIEELEGLITDIQMIEIE